ncbi:ABC transporter substrate-binding protein [Leucobacter sp. UCMA 4100]|uniref:ABC transporter substrate-binding protein n=1 Tax=Leucobacter sp. UCMA 4100 TaxID=2810534 RepID=UPI0022EAE20A|nr:ABC transporter substrate-binding protein [Leucobacter sp. UCMA 4100]MDA3146702.1 ABC transporter substrate-binding protein [Leucobacter sp. UCMA 4100]
MRSGLLARTVATAAATVAAGSLLLGCAQSTDGGAAQKGDTSSGTSITVTDQRGKEVTLDAPAETIASAVIPAPAIIAAVDGSWDRIVGINQSLLDANKLGIISKIFPESVTTPVISGRDFVPNMEEILTLDPDLVVQWGYLGDDFTAPIEDAGMSLVGLEYGTQEDLETWITLFGDLIGKSDRATEMIDWMHTEAADVTKQVESLGAKSPRALSLSYNDTGLGVSTGSDYAQYVFDLTGLTNVAENAQVSEGVASAEQILDWDPEIIFLSAFDEATPEDVYADDRFANVSAVKNKRVYRAPLGVYRWQVPSAESPLFWNWVAALAYPGEFEVDLTAEMKQQISFLYNYELTQEDIDLVLRTDINEQSAHYAVVSN